MSAGKEFELPNNKDPLSQENLTWSHHYQKWTLGNLAAEYIELSYQVSNPRNPYTNQVTNPSYLKKARQLVWVEAEILDKLGLVPRDL